MNITRSKFTAGIAAQGTKVTGLTQSLDPLAQSYSLDLTDGTGASQANQQWHASRTLGAGASETLDLAGSLTDAFGNTVTLARVKAILIKNTSNNAAGVLTVGGAGSNPWASLFGDVSDTIKIRPGGFFLLACSDATGYAVTAGTGDRLQLSNGDSGNPLTYEIVVVGATA